MEMGRAEIEVATNHVEKVDQEEAQADIDIWKYILGHVEGAVVKCAIEIGIANAIESHGSPMTLSELSSALGCVSSSLYRVMKFLTYRGIFQQKSLPSQDSNIIGYAQTPLSRRLMRHGEKSMAAMALLQSSQVMLAPWHALSAHVIDNKISAFEATNGEEFWRYATANPILTDLFNEAMASSARVTVPMIINGFPELFQDLTSLVDVGGGTGIASRIVVKACPWIRGINFDLPHVVCVATECVGIEHVGRNMFSSVPKADAAFLSWVLHDWNDEECIQILKNCKEAIPKDKGKVIIVEAAIDEEENNKNKYKDVGLMLDMAMMTHTNTGKERTLKEWAYVLGEAGFSRHTIKSICAIQSVIEAYP